MAGRPSELATELPEPRMQEPHVKGLFDLALEPAADGGLAIAGGDGRSLSARELARIVHSRGGTDADVRILMPDGGHYLTVLGATAEALGRDVLVTPAGAELRDLVAVTEAPQDFVGTSRGRALAADVAPVDRATGYPVDWLVVQPPSSSTSLPGWFDLVGGLVLPRVGIATIPLPGGLSLASRADFVTRRADAARLGTGHPALVTVAVQVRSGRFVVGDYSGGSDVYDGQSFAAALSSLPLFGADVRLWLEWPDSAEGQRCLRANLWALAETTGAVVWAPPPGGNAEILEGCRDVAARDGDGRVSRWDSYHPPPREPERYVSDLDGRLIPAGGFVVDSYEGAQLVSVPLSRVRAMADRYASLPARQDMFVADVAVLDDGRPAARCADGTLLALGPRQFRQMLAATGWRGSGIALLCDVSSEQISGLRRCLASLGAELGCEITVAVTGELDPMAVPPTAAPPVVRRRPQRHSAIHNWPGDPPSRRSQRAATQPALTASKPTRSLVPQAAAPGLPVLEAEASEPTSPSLDGHWLNAVDPLPPGPLLPAPLPQRPRLVAAPHGGPPHGVRWLPDRPQVNADEFDLVVASAWDLQRAVRDGVPSPHLFLLGRLDERRLAAGSAGVHLLRVRVEPGGAVDVVATSARPPSEVRHLLSPTDVYLLPAGWLARAHVVAGLRVEGDGPMSEGEVLPSTPLTIRCMDARHGVDGLPNEVERWPRSRLRSSVSMFAVLGKRGDSAPDWIGLHRRRPPVQSEDVTLVEVSVGRGRAIDLRKTAARLAPLTSVRSRAEELFGQGTKLILPRRSFGRVQVLRAFRSDGHQWQAIPTHGITPS